MKMSKAPQTVESWPASKVEIWPLENVKPYEKNPRTHPQSQIDLIAASMRDDGVTAPILVDEDGVIIYGHGRRLASLQNGFTHYPVIVARGWTEERKKAVRLKDNSYAVLSSWDLDLLKHEIVDLKLGGYDIPTLGFPEIQLRQVGVVIGTEGQSDPEEAPEPPAKPVSKRGDVWVLGDHRLLCGDSTSAPDVAICLNGAEPHLMVTDPPYGVQYDPAWRAEPGKLGAADGSFLSTKGVRKGAVSNDARADWFETYELFPGSVAYVWHGALFSSVVEASLHESDFQTRAQIVWAKQHAPISRGDYHWRHECCWYMVRKGKTGRWNADRKQNTVWDIANMNAFGGQQEDMKTDHGTQKPIECMKRPIENNSKAGDCVYEPFSGSGTTVIACELTKRKALAIEISESYCDVAVMRWQSFTGKEAHLESTGETFEKVKADRAGSKRGRRKSGIAHRRVRPRKRADNFA